MRNIFMSIQNSEYDDLDRMIAECVMQDAALTSTQLGEKVGLSSSAANERLRRLKHNGYVKKLQHSYLLNLWIWRYVLLFLSL